jgi:inward rectifier potassium channel
MEKASFDPGLTQQYAGNLKRVINKNGEFNVHRTGFTWRDIHPYLVIVNLSWTTFLAIVVVWYILTNSLFAGLYILIGSNSVHGVDAQSGWMRFCEIWFFSSHTLTTVGYGNYYPVGIPANVVASFEALTGWLAFALAAGLLFGRFSRPSARIGFSPNMVVAPYKGLTSLQFRVVNRRTNNLIDLDAQLTLMTVEEIKGRLGRRYTPLELERPHVLFFPLTWTIVHPVEETSPLYGKTPEDLQRLQAEVLVMIKGFDDTFGQTVHARYSYRYDEVTWGARFVPAFEFDRYGNMHVEVNKVGLLEPAALPQQPASFPQQVQA